VKKNKNITTKTMNYFYFFLSAALVNAEEEDIFKLNILHVNDIHSHFEPVNSDFARCQDIQKQDGQYIFIELFFFNLIKNLHFLKKI
jgi:2',3'-cyclic-nucleotide 2'-phosphodiesterase (5'-nucleotidase family)